MPAMAKQVANIDGAMQANIRRITNLLFNKHLSLLLFSQYQKCGLLGKLYFLRTSLCDGLCDYLLVKNGGFL